MSGVGAHGTRHSTRGSTVSGRGSGFHEVFMPDNDPIRSESPVVMDHDEIFREDVEENWMVAICKEVYHSAFTVNALKLTGVLVFMIICGSVETVVYSVNGQRFMAQYLTTLNMLVVLGATIFFSTIVVVKMVTDKEYYNDPLAWTWKGEHALWFFRNIVGIAFCDTVALYMGILSSHSVTAPLRTLLQQASIPMTMFASWMFLRRRYRGVHIAGAIVIIVGIVLAMVQIIWKGNPGARKKQSEVETSDSTWTVVFFLSCIPLAAGSCLKELILTDDARRVDMNQVNAWVACTQFIISICISPLSFFAANIGPHTDMPPFSGFLDNIADGLKCGVWGDTTACNAQCIYVNGNTTDCPDVAGVACDCGLALAPLSVWLYVGVCCCFNLLMLYVIKEGTAVLFWISSAAIIPIVAIISSTEIYSWLDLGKVSFSILQICGLVLVVIGIAVYRSQPEETPHNLEESFRQSETGMTPDASESVYRSIKHLHTREEGSVAGSGNSSWRGSPPKISESVGRGWQGSNARSPTHNLGV